MQVKTLLVALLGMSVAVEALEIHSRSPFSQAIERRQQRKEGAKKQQQQAAAGKNAQNKGAQGKQAKAAQGKQADAKGKGKNAQNNAQQNQQNQKGKNVQNAAQQGQQGQQGQRGGNNGGKNGGNNQKNNNGGGNNGGNNGLALNPKAVQTGSQSDGNNPGKDNQAASATSNNNFINFCADQKLTNGLQIKAGSCNGIPMGKIPSINRMVSSVFVNPQNNDNIPANQDFKIQVQVQNLAAGSFTNATSTYYAAPQDLNGQGTIIGHTHVTVQNTGNGLNPKTPLDPTQFAFFKGINDAGNGQGLLSADVVGGLPAGNYRVCSMSSSSNHQPVLMPVAQRGAQDDCVRFKVSNGGGGNNKNNNNNNNNGAANNAAKKQNNGKKGGNAGGQQNNAQQQQKQQQAAQQKQQQDQKATEKKQQDQQKAQLQNQVAQQKKQQAGAGQKKQKGNGKKNKA